MNPTQSPAAPSSTPKILTTPHPSSSKSSSSEDLVYAASTRAFIFRTLDLLNVSRRHLLSSEVVLSKDLYHKLKESELKERGEELRKEKEQGWGGSWGRWAATGAGVTVSIACSTFHIANAHLRPNSSTGRRSSPRPNRRSSSPGPPSTNPLPLSRRSPRRLRLCLWSRRWRSDGLSSPQTMGRSGEI